MSDDPTEHAKKAAQVLDGPAPEPEPSDDQDATAEEESSTKTESDGSDDAGGPTGLDRLFRTDRTLDLDDATPFWDPRGKGGVNRIGAALKQAGGLKALPPIVWLPIGVAEALYVFADERDLLPGSGSQ